MWPIYFIFNSNFNILHSSTPQQNLPKIWLNSVWADMKRFLHFNPTVIKSNRPLMLHYFTISSNLLWIIPDIILTVSTDSSAYWNACTWKASLHNFTDCTSRLNMCWDRMLGVQGSERYKLLASASAHSGQGLLPLDFSNKAQNNRSTSAST